MLSALLYLRLMSFANWLRVRAQRLRQPKYLLGALVGGAYFYFFFFRAVGGNPARAARHAAVGQAAHVLDSTQVMLPSDWLPAVTAFGALALLVFIALMWVVPTQRAALGFSEAEVAFLFPAPVTRRALVHFRLLSAQFRSLVGALVMMLFSNRWTMIGGNALTHAIGWWFVFSALNLHFSGASFTLTRLGDLGLGAWRRRLWALLALIAVVGLTLARLPAAARLPEFTNEIDLRPFTAWAIAVTSTAPLGWVLWPFKLVLGPFLAVDARQFFLTLGPALAVISLHYLWVVRTAVSFEDASVAYAEKRGARLAAWRAGDRRLGTMPTKARPGPFRLAGPGRPELAFLWKNLLSAWQYFNLRTLLLCAGTLVGICLWLTTHPVAHGLRPIAGLTAFVIGVYVLIAGPQFARQDIRSDLAHADVLKAYPIAGWQIVLGELLTPVVILTGILWLAELVMVFTFQPALLGLPALDTPLRVTIALGLAAVTPALVSLQLLVPNAAALVFPGWFHLTRTRGGGPEVIGQRMIFFFAQLLTMLVALAPAILVAALLVFILQAFVGGVAAVSVAAVFVLLVLLVEVRCGIWLLGQRFERLDLSAELRG